MFQLLRGSAPNLHRILLHMLLFVLSVAQVISRHVFYLVLSMRVCIVAFFCANCKSYEDAMSAGYGRKVKRNSARFKCTANHTDFMFPTDKLLDDIDDFKRKSVSVEDVSCDEESGAESQTSTNTEDELLKDLMVYTGALVQCESVFRAKLNEQSEQFQRILQQ
jgi:hypothetical protein